MKITLWSILLGICLLSACSKSNPDNITSFTDGSFMLVEEDMYAGYSIDVLSDGYILAAGETEINMMKLDQDFNPEWYQSFGEKPAGERIEVQKTRDGQFVLAASKLDANRRDYNAHVIKTDQKGTAQWQRNYGVYSNAKARSIIVTESNQFVFVGSDEYSGSNGSNYTVHWLDEEGNADLSVDNDETVEDQAWKVVDAGNSQYTVLFSASSDRRRHHVGVAKFDTSGAVIWSKIHSDFNTLAEGYDMIRTRDNGYLITGSIYNNSEETDVLLLKLDESGNHVWATSYGGALQDQAYAAVETDDKGFVVVGSTESYGNGKEDIYIIKTNKNGKLKWSRSYGSVATDVAYDVQENSDHELVICGMSDERMFILHTDEKGRP